MLEKWWVPRAWLIVWVGVGVVSSFNDPLVDLVGAEIAVSLFIASGMALGFAWYRLYPRPLAERLALLAGMAVVVVVLGLVIGIGNRLGGDLGSVDLSRPDPGDLTAVGVLAGLVLTETRRATFRPHRRRTPSASRPIPSDRPARLP